MKEKLNWNWNTPIKAKTFETGIKHSYNVNKQMSDIYQKQIKQIIIH